MEKKAVKKIVIISALAVAVLCLTFVALIGCDFLGIGIGKGKNIELDVEKGSSTTAIANELKESGAINYPLAFRVYSRLKGYDGMYKYGYYEFKNDVGYSAIADKLMYEGAKAKTVTVTIPEGTGINDYTKNVNGEDVVVPGIATLLEKKGVCEKADFFEALKNANLDYKILENCNSKDTYYSLEGYLFPDTYNFYAYDSKECAALAVEKMVAQSQSKISDDMYKKAEDLGYSMNEILTMASIIQMEAGNNTSEMKDVAAVFYNRLNSQSFTTLGSSPTCYYGESFAEDDGRYNTYNVIGLPPGPLCSPGIDAIKAALDPTENSPYYYFVTDSKGNFYFHKTIGEQNATINKLKQGNNWIYEYFD
ncbi:MAG: endolytic transglycosylase MltG [Clostridia bacterium]|nr:endolytic transglycosylase MltG [Clostridia bacterium]